MRTKKVGLTELREITRVLSLGQINNIGHECARKFKKECFREQRQINERERAREKYWKLRIEQNRASKIIRPNK